MDEFRASQLLASLAEIFSIYARIEGMKAANMTRERNGDALAYDNEAFQAESDTLQCLANHVRQQY